MNALFARKSVALLPVWLVLILVGIPTFAFAAQPVVFLSDGSDRDTEGDPLDANDYSTGGDDLIGDHIEDSFGVPAPGVGDLVIPVPVRDAVIYLVVEFQDGIPVLHMVKVSGRAWLVEAPDAR